jgi:uncharacterized phage infection (PIP) family protein YhgE
VSPKEFSETLKRLANSILENRPSSEELSQRLEVISSESRKAARVDKFTHKEFQKAIEGLQQLIERLTKTAESLNPQDDARLQIEQEVTTLMNLKGDVSRSLKELSRVDI